MAWGFKSLYSHQLEEYDMKVKELIAILETQEPELDVHLMYDHGVTHPLDLYKIIRVDDDTTDKYIAPRGIVFCAHWESDMEYLVRVRNYKTVG